MFFTFFKLYKWYQIAPCITYRNRILAEINIIIKTIEKTMRELENIENDNNKKYETTKKIKSLKPPNKLLIKGQDGLTADPTEQNRIVVEYFKKTLYKNKPTISEITPRQMTKHFTADEIRNVIAKMKPSKSRECDESN